jgi:hypothetical protein
MAVKEAELPEIDYYRVATAVQTAESKYLDYTYRSYERRYSPRPYKHAMKRNADALFYAIIASGVKRDLDNIVQNLDLIVGGEDQRMLAGSEHPFAPDRMSYGLTEHYGDPPTGTPVEIYSSQVSRRAENGEEILLNASCLRPGEEIIKDILNRRKPRMLKGSFVNRSNNLQRVRDQDIF